MSSSWRARTAATCSPTSIVRELEAELVEADAVEVGDVDDLEPRHLIVRGPIDGHVDGRVPLADERNRVGDPPVDHVDVRGGGVAVGAEHGELQSADRLREVDV